MDLTAIITDLEAKHGVGNIYSVTGRETGTVMFRRPTNAEGMRIRKLYGQPQFQDAYAQFGYDLTVYPTNKEELREKFGGLFGRVAGAAMDVYNDAEETEAKKVSTPTTSQ
jgi:hypothetical protein